MGNNTCKLKLLSLFFSQFSFHMSEKTEDTDYNISLTVSYNRGKNDPSKARIVIDTTVENKSKTVAMQLQTVGDFEIENAGLEPALAEQLIKQNTVAIMFPYIRSQISLLTTQPGMKPIVLQPVNVAAILE